MDEYSANGAHVFEDDELPELAPVGISRLRPYQELAHADVLDYLLTGHQRVALISATGSGKTTIIHIKYGYLNLQQPVTGAAP